MPPCNSEPRPTPQGSPSQPSPSCNCNCQGRGPKPACPGCHASPSCAKGSPTPMWSRGLTSTYDPTRVDDSTGSSDLTQGPAHSRDPPNILNWSKTNSTILTLDF
ncbi:hypothetical protein ACFX1R_036691 [Malus domestica]